MSRTAKSNELVVRVFSRQGVCCLWEVTRCTFRKTAKCGKSETGFFEFGFVTIGSAGTDLWIVPALPVAKFALIASTEGSP